MSKTIHSSLRVLPPSSKLTQHPPKHRLPNTSSTLKVCLFILELVIFVKDIQLEKVLLSTVVLPGTTWVLPELTNAAQEVLQLAEGEPLIVQAGWAALAASFTMSIAIVVWGRSGL